MSHPRQWLLLARQVIWLELCMICVDGFHDWGWNCPRSALGETWTGCSLLRVLNLFFPPAIVALCFLGLWMWVFDDLMLPVVGLGVAQHGIIQAKTFAFFHTFAFVSPCGCAGELLSQNLTTSSFDSSSPVPLPRYTMIGSLSWDLPLGIWTLSLKLTNFCSKHYCLHPPPDIMVLENSEQSIICFISFPLLFYLIYFSAKLIQWI